MAPDSTSDGILCPPPPVSAATREYPWPMSFLPYEEGVSQPTEPGWYVTLDEGHDYPVMREWDPSKPWYCKVFAYYVMARPKPMPCLECADKATEIARLTTLAEGLVDERDALLARVAELDRELVELRKQLEAMKAARNEEYERYHSEHNDERAALANDAMVAKDNLSKAKARNQEILAERDAAEETNRDLLQRIDTLSAELHAARGPSDPISAVAHFAGRLYCAWQKARRELDDALAGARRALGVETLRDRKRAADNLLSALYAADTENAQELAVGVAVRVVKDGPFQGRTGTVLRIDKAPNGNADDNVLTVEVTSGHGTTAKVPLFPADVELV